MYVFKAKFNNIAANKVKKQEIRQNIILSINPKVVFMCPHTQAQEAVTIELIVLQPETKLNSIKARQTSRMTLCCPYFVLYFTLSDLCSLRCFKPSATEGIRNRKSV